MEEQDGIIGKIPCPLCDGIAHFKTEIRTLSYRDETYMTECFFYHCDHCNEGFTTTQLDDLTLKNLTIEFKKRHPDGQPTPWDDL